MKTTLQLPTFTACELLATLRKRLFTDEPTVNFDFFGLTFHCSALLQQIGNVLEGPESEGFDTQCVQLLLARCSALGLDILAIF